MIQIDLPPLVKRLNLFSRQALEMAASECMSQQAAEITVSHVLIQMLAMPRSDLRVITRQGDIGMEELRQALTVENYTTARSADSYPAFSPMLVEWLKEGWLLASAEMQHSELRGGVLLLALLHSPLRYIPPAAARLLTGINRDRLQQDFVQWTQESAESVVPDADGKGAGTMTDASDTLLARYAKNMTADARNGRLDPVLCRDHEIDLMIDILCRRRKNNPVVVGEAGVGKSALIEGLALRIVAGQVPDKLKNTDIMTLDLGALQAGASVKGEFEKRFKGLMAEVISSPVPVILFIDEAHTLIGAGNQQGGLDNPRSAQDASLDAFERFFKPDGILDTFYQQNLKLFIDNDLSLEDGDNNVIIREDIIAQLETAQTIRDIFFSKQNGLGTSFAVETVSLSGNKRRSVLNLDGQLVDYSQGRNYTAHLVWPNNMREGNESKLTLIGTSGNAPRSISFSGPWAQFRLFGAGQLTGVQDGNFTVRFSVDGGAMTYRVHTDTEDNPFSGGLFSQFGLSDTLY